MIYWWKRKQTSVVLSLCSESGSWINGQWSGEDSCFHVCQTRKLIMWQCAVFVSFQVNGLCLKPWTVVSVSVQGSRSVGRRRLRSIHPQTDEPEGKPGAVWQYVHPPLHLCSVVFNQVLSSHCFLSRRRQSDGPTHQLRRSLVSPTASFSSPLSNLPWNPPFNTLSSPSACRWASWWRMWLPSCGGVWWWCRL